MPEQRQKRISSDIYSSVYEQYYFKNTQIKKIKPIKKIKKQKKKSSLNKLFSYICVALLLFYILPFSFNTFIVDTFPVNTSKALNVDYKKLLYPTHNYLYKDLFLGKYVVKEATYKNHIMVDIQESYERTGLKNNLIALSQEYKKITIPT